VKSCIFIFWVKRPTQNLQGENDGYSSKNKCIGDDTKAAGRQSLNCIKNKKWNKIWWKQFSIWRMEFLHPAMWYVALGWHATEFAKTSAYWNSTSGFDFNNHRSRHVILHQSPKFYPNQTTLGRKKLRHVDFQDGGSQPSWILGIQ